MHDSYVARKYNSILFFGGALALAKGRVTTRGKEKRAQSTLCATGGRFPIYLSIFASSFETLVHHQQFPIAGRDDLCSFFRGHNLLALRWTESMSTTTN